MHRFAFLRLLTLAAADRTCLAADESCNQMAAKQVNVALLGVGGVGRALVDALVGARAHHRDVYGLQFNLKVLADSSGFLSGDLSDAQLRKASDAKAKGKPLSTLTGATGGDAGQAIVALGKNAIIVDVTASGATTPLLIEALSNGQKIVAANKKPFSSEQSPYDALVGYPVRHNSVRHESTVGAGLPAIAALNR